MCLDLGCGGGEVTFDLARLGGARRHVIGVDMDEDKLALARQSIPGQGVTNVEFRKLRTSRTGTSPTATTWSTAGSCSST